MKRLFLIVVGFVAIVGFVSAAPKGGQIANNLYANSLYGIAHPLPQTSATLPVMPYALSSSQKSATRGRDLMLGVVGNIFIPGLGSALIGDHNALWIFTGYALSVVAITAGALGAAAATSSAILTGTTPNLTLWYVLMGVGGVGSAGFFGWGIYSPIHYVNQKYPAS